MVREGGKEGERTGAGRGAHEEWRGGIAAQQGKAKQGEAFTRRKGCRWSANGILTVSKSSPKEDRTRGNLVEWGALQGVLVP